MSDNKLIECRAERDRLKDEVAKLHNLLNAPQRNALKRLRFHNGLLRDTAAAQRSKIASLEQSAKDLFEQIEPLREALRAEKHRTTELVQERAGIVAWFNQHGHKLAPTEPIVEKLDNLQSTINTQEHIADVVQRVWKDHPEVKDYFKAQFEKDQETQNSKKNPFGLAAKTGGLAMSSNLPPGCSDSDIPGNTPTDKAVDKAISDKECAACKHDGTDEDWQKDGFCGEWERCYWCELSEDRENFKLVDDLAIVAERIKAEADAREDGHSDD